MEREEPELRTLRTSEATAEVTGFADDAALLQALFDAVKARVAAAIAHRQWYGLLSRRGDAAAALFLDGDRIDGLLGGPSAPPPEDMLAAARDAEHVVDAVAARVAATGDVGPLSRALRRWNLDASSTLLLGALLAAELSPRLGRVLAYLGGDASRPGVTVDAAAALFGDGVPGALVVEAQIGRGAPLFDLGLVAARPLELPLLRRTLGLAPRVAQLARGWLALDPALAHAITPIATAEVPRSPSLDARIDAVLRAAPPVIGVVRATRDASPAERLAQVAARRKLALWQVDVRALADEGIERAVIREALLLGAALLVRVEAPGPGPDAWRVVKLLDRVAARIPTFVDIDERADLEPRWSLPVVPIELGPLGDADRLAVWTDALGPSARLSALERARRMTLPISAMRRTAGAIAALAGSDASASLLSIAIAQVMREPSLPRLVSRDLDELVLPAPLRARLHGVCETARLRARWLVGIVGRAGSGKTALAAAIAGALETQAVVLDVAGVVGRPAELDRGLTELLRFAAVGGLGVIDAGDAIPHRRGVPASPEIELIARRLAAASGAVVMLVRESSPIDPMIRRWFNETIELAPLDSAGREALWRRALAGTSDPAAAARALCELPLSVEQIFRFAERALASGASTPDGLRAEALRLVRESGGA